VNSQLRNLKLKKPETSLYRIIRMVRNVFRYPERFKRGSRVRRTNGQIDRSTDRMAFSNSAVYMVRLALIRLHERSPWL